MAPMMPGIKRRKNAIPRSIALVCNSVNRELKSSKPAPIFNKKYIKKKSKRATRETDSILLGLLEIRPARKPATPNAARGIYIDCISNVHGLITTSNIRDTRTIISPIGPTSNTDKRVARSINWRDAIPTADTNAIISAIIVLFIKCYTSLVQRLTTVSSHTVMYLISLG